MADAPQTPKTPMPKAVVPVPVVAPVVASGAAVETAPTSPVESAPVTSESTPAPESTTVSDATHTDVDATQNVVVEESKSLDADATNINNIMAELIEKAIDDEVEPKYCDHCFPDFELVVTGGGKWLHCNGCGCRFVVDEDGNLDLFVAGPGEIDHPRCKAAIDG